MDAVLRAENRERKIVESSQLEPHLYVDSHCAKGKSAVEIVIWRGDICTLRVDAIVNAANGAMLGCFQPSHRCIDNVIHRCAGPRLREACRKVIQTECVDEDGDDVGASGREGWELRTGDARITKAFGNLPSSFVLHTVGPIVPKTFLGRATRPTSVHRAQLAQCYKSCLRLADEMGVKSIAFCCISTGLFGYPYVYISIDIVVRRTMHQCLRASIEHSARRRQKEAASVALQSVKEYFERNVSSVTRVRLQYISQNRPSHLPTPNDVNGTQRFAGSRILQNNPSERKERRRGRQRLHDASGGFRRTHFRRRRRKCFACIENQPACAPVRAFLLNTNGN